MPVRATALSSGWGPSGAGTVLGPRVEIDGREPVRLDVADACLSGRTARALRPAPLPDFVRVRVLWRALPPRLVAWVGSRV